jgi:hypothetical protein
VSSDELIANALVCLYWDDTIDGNPNNSRDLAAFLEPFYFTTQLQVQHDS